MSTGSSRRRLIAGISMGIVICAAATAQACPTCQAGLADDGDLQWAYAVSIAVMMAAPFCLLGGWVFALWRMCRRAANEPGICIPGYDLPSLRD
jgi:hypothetical protein